MSLRHRAGQWPELFSDVAGEPALAVETAEVSSAASASQRTFAKPQILSPASAPLADRPQCLHRSTTWPVLALAMGLVVIAVKFVLLPFAVSTPGELVHWLLRLDIVAAPDLAFVAGLTASCWLMERVLAKWSWVSTTAWRCACAAGFALVGTYAVASIPMFKVTMVPFTIRLLSFVGGPSVMASSVTPYLPPGIVAGLIAAPACVLLAPWLARRRLGETLSVRMGYGCIAGGLLVAVNGAICGAYVQSNWTDPNRWERRIAQSPHWVMIRSCLEELSKDRPFTHSYSFDEIDDTDFRRPPLKPDMRQPLFAPAERPKNVLLIVLESTAAQYVGAHGSRFDTTPNIDRLAATHGVVFENVYAQAASSCKSLVALTNSAYSRPDWLLIVRDHPEFDVPALPRILRDRGYRTCYAHAGYWSWQGRDKFLLDRGVDRLIDAAGQPKEQVSSWGINDEAMYQGLLDWIDSDPSQPFFAFAYTIETHHPYDAPQIPHDFGVKSEEFYRYLCSLRGADRKIAWLLDELKRRDLLDSTLVAITSDHGESFGQHNQMQHAFGVYEQTVHVPLVMLHPALAELPRRDAAVARHLDIAPTLLDALDIPAPAEWQGRSLLRPSQGEPAYFMSVGNEITLGIRDGEFKYHYYVDTQREELFNLSDDPDELKNLAQEDPQRAGEYRRRVGGWVTYQREFLAKHGVR